MQITKTISNDQKEIIQNSFNSFFDKFGINKLLHSSNIRKIRGVKVKDVLLKITELPFCHKNFYQGIVKNPEIAFNKSVPYDFLKNSSYNWRLFLLKLVKVIIQTFFKPLSSENRDEVLILDDTPYPRNRSKQVELLAKVYDHVSKNYFKGFRLLSMCWSDGNSLLPVDFALLSSSKPKNRYQEMSEQIDKRSCGYRRRKEAVSKATELILPMLKRVLQSGVKAKYLLMDSWFGFPSVIASASEMINVICMVKNMKTVFYYQEGKTFTLGELYKKTKKRRGRAAINGSQIVEIKHGEQTSKAKIVFVKNRHKKHAWLAILSTDDKTFGGVFRDMIDEMEDISFVEALNRILHLAFEEIKKIKDISKETIDKIIDIFPGIIIKKYRIEQCVA